MSLFIDKQPQDFDQRNLLAKWNFLRKAFEDATLGSSAKLVLAELLFHHNTKTNRCFPGETRIAERLGLSKSTVERAVRELKARGLVTVKRQFNKPNEYRFNWGWMPLTVTGTDTVISDGSMPSSVMDGSHHPCGHSAINSDGLTNEYNKRNENEKITLLRDERESSPSSDVSPSSRDDDDDDEAMKMFEEFYSGKLKLTYTSDDEKSLHQDSTGSASAAGAADDTFLRFWQAYPEHINESAAKRAFIKALEKVNAETLIRAAVRYAKRREGKPAPHYFSHAANWLKDERWNDEDVSPVTTVADVAPVQQDSERSCQGCRRTVSTQNTDPEYYCQNCAENIHECMGGEWQAIFEECRELDQKMQEERNYNDYLF